MERWRVLNYRLKEFSEEISEREAIIRKSVELVRSNNSWNEFVIQKFQDNKWLTVSSATQEAVLLIEEGEKEGEECDFDPPCQSCQERATKK